MQILVTGSRGYIGAVLVPRLMAGGHKVVSLDADLFEKGDFGQWSGLFPFNRKDVRDIQASDLKGFDAIVHLAGLSDDLLGTLFPRLAFDINHLATLHLATLAKSVGISRFVFASSCSVYGDAGNDLVTEETVPKPISPYGKSKVSVEHELTKTSRFQLSPTILRIATSYGVSPRLRLDLVLNNLVALAFTTGSVSIKGDGTPWRPLVHIEDVARGFAAVIRAPLEIVHNKIYNLGRDEENYRVREIAEIVQQTVPGCHIEYAKNPSPDRRCCRADFGKIAHEIPGYRPQWNIRLGAEELYGAYKKNQLELKALEGPTYKRIDTIKQLLETDRLTDDLRWKQK